MISRRWNYYPIIFCLATLQKHVEMHAESFKKNINKSEAEIPIIGVPVEHRVRKPEWLKARIPGGEQYAALRRLIDDCGLHTVCEEAHCPNMGECWNSGTATFMILGDTCTRSCGFCAIKTGRAFTVDQEEPKRVGEAVRLMKLRHAVVTSVNRDELYDGGASIFAATIREIRAQIPSCRIEVLIPDFQGSEEALNIVLDAQPDILNHNTETVPRLYKTVRPQAKYRRSLDLLKRAKLLGFTTKSGVMMGLGETNIEILETMRDLHASGCDILTIGQYMQPSSAHLPVLRYVHPDEFAMFSEHGLAMGFRHVESGPLVRSSYHAAQQL